MGSGKTSVGRVLAERLGWRFADLDDCAAEQLGLPVPAIFAERGEAAFRVAETDALRGLLRGERVILALGGGAPETPAVQDLLTASEHTLVVLLDAPFEVLYARCVGQAQDPAATARPLLGERPAAAARYARRQPLYARLAHHVADAAAGPPEVIAERLLAELRDRLSPS